MTRLPSPAPFNAAHVPVDVPSSVLLEMLDRKDNEPGDSLQESYYPKFRERPLGHQIVWITHHHWPALGAMFDR